MMRMPRSFAGERALPLAIISAWSVPKEHSPVENRSSCLFWVNWKAP